MDNGTENPNIAGAMSGRGFQYFLAFFGQDLVNFHISFSLRRLTVP